MNWLIKYFLYLRIKYKWFRKVELNNLEDLTFCSSVQDHLVHNELPWGWKNLWTNYGKESNIRFTQRYGRFYCHMKLLDKGCFWLLNISHLPYNEIDHIEIKPDYLYVTTWYGKNGGQTQCEPKENINPNFKGHNHITCPRRSVKYYDPLVRRWILDDSHLFTIIWRKWFVAWRIDNILIGVKLFYPIPRQHMSMIASNCEFTYFESTL